MIEKPKRPTKIPNQDNKQPQTINELIRRYDLENTKIYDFLDSLVTNLNTAQEYMKKVISNTISSEMDNLVNEHISGTVLFENQDGSTETIMLSESSANYRYLEIFYKNRYDHHSSVKIYNPNDKRVLLQSFHVFKDSGTVVGMSRIVSVIGATIENLSNDGYGEWWSYNTGLIDNNAIYITRIVGYK